MPKSRDTNSTNRRVNFLADPDWANHAAKVAQALHGADLTTYIKMAVNAQLRADGHPWNPPLDHEPQPKQKAPTKKRGRPAK